MNPISAIADAISSIFKWMTGRNATKNTTAAIAAKNAENEQAAKDKTNQAIANKDTDEIRKELAE